MRSLMLSISMLLFSLISFPMLSNAHQNSESSLNLEIEGRQFNGEWQVNLLDLQLAFGLDENLDGNISWEEILLVEKELTRWLFNHLEFNQTANHIEESGACAISSSSVLVENRSTGTYLLFPFVAHCQKDITSANHQTHLAYSLFFDFDQQHRAVLTYQWLDTNKQWLDTNKKEPSVTEILRFDQAQTVFKNPSSALTESFSVLFQFFKEGIWHIWIGLDHILFLIALIIPSVRLASRTSFRNVLSDITLIVTCFTLAHSVTLAGAAMQWLILPSWLVETAIALSVAIAGFNMLYPVFDRQRWLIAILFGLIHGLGFASVLSDLTLSPTHFYAGLLGFNIGVEFGQMVIVAGLLPIMYALRNSHFYLRRFIPGTGVSIAGIGCIWVISRGFVT